MLKRLGGAVKRGQAGLGKGGSEHEKGWFLKHQFISTPKGSQYRGKERKHALFKDSPL